MVDSHISGCPVPCIAFRYFLSLDFTNEIDALKSELFDEPDIIITLGRGSFFSRIGQLIYSIFEKP